MNGLIGVGFAIAILVIGYQGIKDWGADGLETPQALQHDAPIIADTVKQHLPSKEELKSVAENQWLPAIKETADNIKSELNK